MLGFQGVMVGWKYPAKSEAVGNLMPQSEFC